MVESIGARLRQARELRRLSLQQVSESTKVRAHYLQALESDDHSVIPSAAQARGFLRIYAEFLELNLADLVPPPAQPAPEVSTASATAEAVTSLEAKPTLWESLRALFRRAPKQADAGAALPTESTVAPSIPDVGSSPEPAPVPNATPAEAGSDASPSTAGSADVKKNGAA
jgi:transcriptional regulator with XRE-family HTH domain